MHVAKDNPLPVFVRGDDVAFGLMHTGKHTVTMNGIAVWHADFALKNNPSSLYYEVRNFALIDTLHSIQFCESKFVYSGATFWLTMLNYA